jgi:hypothetical protein
MWNANEHSDDEDLQWAWLRAMEWGSWPTFISQPIAPIAILFYPWWSVVLFTVVANVLWILFVRHKIVVPVRAYWGVIIVRLKWITCPIAAYTLWRGDMRGAATLALLWPLVILVMSFGSGRVGDIQKMFLQRLGY